MEIRSPNPNRGPRLALVGLGVLALLAIVTLATRSGFGAQSDAAPSPVYLSYAFSAFLVLFVLMIPITIWLHLMQAREVSVERPTFLQSVVRSLLSFGLVLAIVAFALYLRHRHGHLPHPHIPGTRHPGKGKQGAKGAAESYEPTFEWPVLAAAIGILVPLIAWAVLAHRRRIAQLRRAVRSDGDESVAEELSREISDAIDDLRAEPDARRAVIAAYARMEGVLARRGLPRAASETPVEYLGRVLVDLDARPDAVRRLTDLFQRAKFSPHEIDAAAKEDAIGALAAIRDDLRGEA